eukprot:gene5937-6176_t
MFAGNKPTQPFLRRYTGYVEQFDTLLPILTVEEMLMYTAELKRPLSEPLKAKQAAVEALMDKLALTSCRNVKIGNPLVKGISGGQAKRTNIGIALITNPRVLFLDEPTSGLDSFTANEVMGVVRGLINDDVTIVATIHSPTAYAFSLFDSLMLLVRGRVVYCGPIINNAPLQYVQSLDISAPETAGKPRLSLQNRQHHPDVVHHTTANPAEWLIDCFTEADREGQGHLYADAYEASQLKLNNSSITAQLSTQHPELSAQVLAELSVKSSTVTPWWWGLFILSKYRSMQNFRDPAFLGPRIGAKLVMGVLIMTLYLGIGSNFSASNYTNMAAVAFMWVTGPAFGAASYVPAIVLDRGLFVRERNDGLYRAVTYLAHKMCEELVINTLASLAISAIVFYGVQLQGSFVLFWLIYLLTSTVGVVLAYFVAAVSPNMDVANAALPTYVAILLYFGGFMITFDKMPPWWKWFSFINPLRYSWTAVMLNQFGAHDPVWVEGKTILEFYGIQGQSMWANLGYVAAFVAFFLACAWIALTFSRYQKR